MSFHKIALAIASLSLSGSVLAATVHVNVKPGDPIQSFQASSTTGFTTHEIDFQLASGYTYDLSITLTSSYLTQGGNLVFGFNPLAAAMVGAAPVFSTTTNSFTLGGMDLESSTDKAAFNASGLGAGLWQLFVPGTTWDQGTLHGTVDVKRAVAVTTVPEPETYAMMLAGLGAVGLMARRRKAA